MGKFSSAVASTARNPARKALIVALGAILFAGNAFAQANGQHDFNIPAGTLESAVGRFGAQSGIQITYQDGVVSGKKSKSIKGRMELREALDLLLAGTGLSWSFVNDTTVVIRVKGNADPSPAPAPAPSPSSVPPKAAVEHTTVLPEVLVRGSKSLNTDVQRTEDDVLPYVVFDREEIEKSQATNVEEFLKTRLPMVTDRGTASRNDPVGNLAGNRSSINLRGLGANQTLILVNGRRAPGVLPSPGADLAQPDVNGIPIAAIERIEVLPASASGIYGGGATGGVINIILRKDYSGTEVQVTYDNSFDTDSARRRVDLSSGISLEGGRTQVMVTGSYADGNDLLARDRNFIGPARARAYQNAPAWFAQTGSLSSSQTNFTSVYGTDLTLQDGTPFGSTFGTVPTGYLGGDGGAGLLAGAGTLNLAIPEGRTGQGQSLSAVPENQALTLTIRREMSEAVDVYLDLSATRSKSVTVQGLASPRVFLAPGQVGNPFQDYVYASLPNPHLDSETLNESSTQRANGGVIIDLSHGWTAGLDVNWNSESNAYTSDRSTISSTQVSAAVAAGEIDLFRDLNQFPIDFSKYLNTLSAPLRSTPSYTTDYTARVAGPLFDLPAGEVRVTGLVSHRLDKVSGLLVGRNATTDAYYHPRSQAVNSAYVEALVPLFSEAQNIALLHSLDLQLSARLDRYANTTSARVVFPKGGPIPDPVQVTNNLESTDYTVGLRYMPIPDLTLRASYATGFLPPTLTQLLTPFSFESFMFLPDPQRGNTASFTPMELIVGGNPDAKPESSTSQSVGLIYTPSFLRGLRISADFVRIEKTDELVTLDQDVILANEALFPGRVVRGPNLPGDPAGWAGVVTSIDASLVNAARSRVEATDIQIDYERDFGDVGWFRFYAVGTIQSTMSRQLASSTPMVNRVDFVDGPVRLRLNAGVDWQRGPWSLALNTQFYDEYKVFPSVALPSTQALLSQIQGSSKIPSQTYTDISGRYVFESGWLAGTQLSVGVRNLFNQKPPLVATGDLSGGYSTFGDPRLRTYSVSIRKSF